MWKKSSLRKRAEEAFKEDEGVPVYFSSECGIEDVHRDIVQAVEKAFYNEHGISIKGDRLAYWRVYENTAKAAALFVSGRKDGVEITIPFITADATGPKHLTMNLIPRKR